MNREKLLKEIKDEVINLKKSPLYKQRVKNNLFPVIGEGNHYAKIMLIGEAPGKNEVLKGRPFCGKAGKILDNLLHSINIQRNDVYITNIVKDQPPNNRDPLEQEIEIYSCFLDRQIDIIQPEIIVGLGRFSCNYLLNKFNLKKEIKTITLMHGRVFNTQSKYGPIKIITSFHPAAAIYDRKKEKLLLQAFKKLNIYL